MKKFARVLIAAAALALLVAPATAYANNGPHGGYVADTDMCAACHRAHTAPSSITWTDNQNGQKNALLITDTSDQNAYLFCLACHDTGAQGADTNVTDGVYEGNQYGAQNASMISGPFGGVDQTKEGALYAVTQSGEATVTSTHLVTGSWGAYGGGLFNVSDSSEASGNMPQYIGTGNKIVMTCTTCHDPHGTSNYRLLKAQVNGNTVGGYDTNGDPAPFVISNEVGFPQGGFQTQQAYDATYTPNYTKAQYAQPVGNDQTKGMTGWCTGCHTVYAVADGTPVNGVTPNGSVYNSGDAYGLVARHRHPMNVAMSTYTGSSKLNINSGLPLDQAKHADGAGNGLGGNAANSDGDWIECLTCHNAHGATTSMTGWADLGAQKTEDVVGSRGVLPVDSNLLKMDNRGVCEACHNK